MASGPSQGIRLHNKAVLLPWTWKELGYARPAEKGIRFDQTRRRYAPCGIPNEFFVNRFNPAGSAALTPWLGPEYFFGFWVSQGSSGIL